MITMDDNSKVIFVPAGTYYISAKLDNPENVVLIGAGWSKTTINIGESFLKNDISSSIIAKIYFTTATTNDNKLFPAKIISSTVQDCQFRYFHTIFSRLQTCTVIKNNYCAYLRGCFSEYTVDSLIDGNYINAPKIKNPQTVAFISINYSRVVNNFIDYMFKVFAPTKVQDIGAVIVSNNTFDLCYTIFYKFCDRVTFTGNSVVNMTKSENWDVSDNQEMDETNWCIYKRTTDSGSQPFTNCYFGGNIIKNQNLDMYLDFLANKYPTNDIIIDDTVSANKINFKAYKSSSSIDGQNIKIRPMLYRVVESLPSASLSSNYVSFNNDMVIYDGNLYQNINGTWKQLT